MTASRRRGRALLAGGVLLGASLAGVDLVGSDEGPVAHLERGVVARVNGQPIHDTELRRGVAALEADRRTSAAEGTDRERVLERLVEEELLVQGALELGLAERDRRVRADLAAAMIDVLASRAAEETPDAAELRRFYEAESSYFRSAPRMRVQHRYFASSEDAALARRTSAGGDSLPGDAAPVPLPRGWVSTRDLTATLGPTAARAVMDLSEGETSAPLRVGGGVHLVRVIERREGRQPPLSEIRETVLGEYRRRAGDRALRSYLEARRAQADIVLAEES